MKKFSFFSCSQTFFAQLLIKSFNRSQILNEHLGKGALPRGKLGDSYGTISVMEVNFLSGNSILNVEFDLVSNKPFPSVV
jgi:hypothetical protein